MLYYSMLYHIMLDYIMVYYTMLYYIVLRCNTNQAQGRGTRGVCGKHGGLGGKPHILRFRV